MKLNITPAEGQARVRDKFSLSTMKTEFPNWYKRWTEKLGRNEQDFQNLSMYVCRWHELVFGTSVFGPLNPTASTTDIETPEGDYWVNFICEYGYADYSFGGTFEYHPGNGSTNISVWHEQWMDPRGRDLFRHAMHGTDLSGSYSESFSFTNVRLVGRAAKAILADPSYKSTGLSVWDAGETSKVERIYAEGFNNVGVNFIRGTPISAHEITVFNNCDAGVRLEGCAGNTGDFKVVSGDDNGALIEMVPGYGRESGGQFHFGALKSEAGVTAIGRNPHRPQRLLSLRGQFGVNVGVARGSHSQVRVENLIEVDCRLTDGNKQGSNLVIGSINGFNYANTIKDVANGWTAKSPGDYQCYELHYAANNGGKVWNPFFQFDGAPNAGGGTVTPPPTGERKDKRTYNTLTGPTKVDERIEAPAGINPIASTKLVNVKFKSLPALGTLAWINSSTFIGQDGYLWSVNNGGLVRSAVLPVVNTAVNLSLPCAGSLTHVIGSGAGSTCVFTGSVELY